VSQISDTAGIKMHSNALPPPFDLLSYHHWFVCIVLMCKLVSTSQTFFYLYIMLITTTKTWMI